MKIEKEGGWFRPRGYSHFDYPPLFQNALKLASDPNSVASHSFLPLLSFTDVKRQFRTDNSDLSIPRNQRPKIVKQKKRDLRYASHRDSAIYAYYAFNLQSRYEALLKKEGLDHCVIGYRSGLGSNIDLAAAAFAEIALKGSVTVLCFDIENFFPSISHAVLKKALIEVLGETELADDWYAVFKNVTRYQHIELKALGQQEGFDPEEPPFPIVKNIAEALSRSRKSKIIQSNKGNCDVPQGTPISAVFANASMLEFDRRVEAWATENGSSYRRYSDDVMLIVPPSLEQAAVAMIGANASAVSLTVHPGKTEISRFLRRNSTLTSDIPVTYLGFTFDGERVALRSRTLSRYYRRMTYAARGAVRQAGKAGQPVHKTFKRALIRDFTHLGHSNFYSYAKRADGKLAGSIVKKQLKRHFQILLRKLKNRGR